MVNSLKIKVVSNYHWMVYEQEILSFIGASSKDETGYTWTFGDGSKSIYKETSTISHAFNETGEYQINLTVNDDDGGNDTIFGTITVVEHPMAVFDVTDVQGVSLGPNYTVAIGETFVINASQSKGEIEFYEYGYNNVNAFLPDVQRPEPSFSYSYHQAGNYNIGIRVRDELGNRSQTSNEEFIQITVLDPQEIDEDDAGEKNTPVFYSLLILLGALFVGLILVIQLPMEFGKDK
jgi:hypothetical protein